MKSCPKAHEHVLEETSCCQMPVRSRLWNSALKMPLNPASFHRSRCCSTLEGCSVSPAVGEQIFACSVKNELQPFEFLGSRRLNVWPRTTCPRS